MEYLEKKKCMVKEAGMSSKKVPMMGRRLQARPVLCYGVLVDWEGIRNTLSV
jgi:hypothetical protein